jgi:valyl-tRNA synthetase
LITTDDIELKDINGLLDYFNISIKKIGTKRINTKANVKIIGKQIIEYFDDFVDPADKLVKLNKEKIRLENEIKRSQNILSNKKFLQHAPNEKVKEEQAKFAQYQEQYQKILEHIKKIS